MSLAQEGYPRPDDKGDDGTRKYRNIEEMLPDYAFALGGTDKIKQIIQWVRDGIDAAAHIKRKHERIDAYDVGGASTRVSDE